MYNKRQDLILDFIKDNPKTTRENIEQFLQKMGDDSSKMTITRDLKTLIADGVITKSGQACLLLRNVLLHKRNQSL